MTNQQRQKQLNEQKWYVSKAKRLDQSGKMDWCKYCDNKNLLEDKCVISQEEIDVNCLCARAYNRMVRAITNKNKGRG